MTGTPGVGKTTIALELSRIYGAALIKLDELITPTLRWDPELQTYIITNEDYARRLIMERLSSINSQYIIDTIAVNLIDPSLVDWCIVLRLEPTQLMRRLIARGWPRCKIVENVLAEVVGSSLTMAINTFGEDKIIEVDTTNKDVESIVKYIVDKLREGRPIIGVVDWLNTVDTEFLVNLSKEIDNCITRKTGLFQSFS